MSTIKRSGVVCATAGALTALALSFAQTARADEGTYVNEVAAHGVTPGPTIIALGHQICADVSANGVAGLDNETSYGLLAGLSSHDVSVIVVSAIYHLCPSNMVVLDAYLGGSYT